MSNNDLVFVPKSADDLNKQGRQSEVLVAAIEKCEKLEKQLKIAMNGLFEICNNPSPDFNRILYAREIWHNVKELDK